MYAPETHQKEDVSAFSYGNSLQMTCQDVENVASAMTLALIRPRRIFQLMAGDMSLTCHNHSYLLSRVYMISRSADVLDVNRYSLTFASGQSNLSFSLACVVFKILLERLLKRSVIDKAQCICLVRVELGGPTLYYLLCSFVLFFFDQRERFLTTYSFQSSKHLPH